MLHYLFSFHSQTLEISFGYQGDLRLLDFSPRYNLAILCNVFRIRYLPQTPNAGLKCFTANSSECVRFVVLRNSLANECFFLKVECHQPHEYYMTGQQTPGRGQDQGQDQHPGDGQPLQSQRRGTSYPRHGLDRGSAQCR